MVSRVVTCPVCYQPGFNTSSALCSALVDAAVRRLSCPVCDETFIGLDKLTIHLFGHNLFFKGTAREQQNGVVTVERNQEDCGNTATTNPLLYFQVETGQLFTLEPKTVFMQVTNEAPSDVSANITGACGASGLNDIPPCQQHQVCSDVSVTTEEFTQPAAPLIASLTKPSACLPETNSQEISSDCRMACNECDLNFSNKALLAVHKQLTHKSSSSKLSGILRHEKPSRTPLSCNWCSASFNLKSSLQIHVKVTHPGQGELNCKEAEKFSCQHCDKSFLKECILHQHLKLVHGEKPWQCTVCSKLFTTKYFLRKHKRIHTGETPYACSLCNKVFTFQQSYHKHMLYHTDEKPYCCSHCGRLFKELSTLTNHERIHSGEKPFVCETCGKSFRQRVSYLVHRRIHTGVMPYKCTACNKLFRYKISQRTHKCPEYPPGVVVKTNPPLLDQSQELLAAPSLPLATRQGESTEILGCGNDSVNSIQNSLLTSTQNPSDILYCDVQSNDNLCDRRETSFCSEKTSCKRSRDDQFGLFKHNEFNAALEMNQTSSATKGIERLHISLSELEDHPMQEYLKVGVHSQSVSVDDSLNLDIFFDHL